MNKIKIGITCSDLMDLYSNGCKFNVLLWYDFLSKLNYDVYLITNKEYDKSKSKYKYYNFYNLFENKQLKKNYLIIHKEFFDFDYILSMGLYLIDYYKLLQINNINTKIIGIVLGSIYHNDFNSIIRKDFPLDCIEFNNYDEIWISPHFEFTREYYKIRYKTDNIYIGPYFWRNDLILQNNLSNKIINDYSLLNIGIIEPNLEQAKNFIIPFAICEKGYDYVNKVCIFSTKHLTETSFIKSFIGSSKLHMNGKAVCYPRVAMPEIFEKFCNCIVSCVQNCDLNYIYLECFYLGIPLIHNSPMLKDYGYYYPELDVSKGAEQIKYVLENHNREEYINKHKKILHKYSIDNPLYKMWIKSKIEEDIHFDL